MTSCLASQVISILAITIFLSSCSDAKGASVAPGTDPNPSNGAGGTPRIRTTASGGVDAVGSKTQTPPLAVTPKGGATSNNATASLHDPTGGSSSVGVGGADHSGLPSSVPSGRGGQVGSGNGGSQQLGGASMVDGHSAFGGTAGTSGRPTSGGSIGMSGLPTFGGSIGMSGLPTTGGNVGMSGRPATGGSSGASGRAGASGASTAGASSTAARAISFGTLLNANTVMAEAKSLAKSLASPGSSQWRAKGDQHRSYRFAEANVTEPYRLYIPSSWDGQSDLPLVMFLHGSGSDENTYLDQNNKQMIELAQQHGFVLVSPLGDQGAYGNFLRLSSPFGKPDEAAKLMSQVTVDSERTNELSEKDVINVLELVLSEYPIDRGAMFLTGHSMGSGGTWYIGGKYAEYWTGLAPMSGPFVQEAGFPWDSVRTISLFVTEGTQAPSLDGSRTLRDWLKKNGFKLEYKEVNADHGGMVPLVLGDVFDFFERNRTQ